MDATPVRSHSGGSGRSPSVSATSGRNSPAQRHLVLQVLGQSPLVELGGPLACRRAESSAAIGTVVDTAAGIVSVASMATEHGQPARSRPVSIEDGGRSLSSTTIAPPSKRRPDDHPVRPGPVPSDDRRRRLARRSRRRRGPETDLSVRIDDLDVEQHAAEVGRGGEDACRTADLDLERRRRRGRGRRTDGQWLDRDRVQRTR